MLKLLALAWYCLWFWIIYARWLVYHLTTDNQELNKLATFQIEHSSCLYGYLRIVQTPFNLKFYSNPSYQLLWSIPGLSQNPSLLLSKMELNVVLLLAWTIFFWLLSAHSLAQSWHLHQHFPHCRPQTSCCTIPYLRNILFPRTLWTSWYLCENLSKEPTSSLSL